MSPELNRTIRVDDVVHGRLEQMKNEHNVGTFNDVLRHELGLVPPAKVDELAAYLPEELQTFAHDLVNGISGVYDFMRSVREVDDAKVLVFIAPEADEPIVEIKFGERFLAVFYKNQHGEMREVGRAHRKPIDGEVRYNASGVTHADPDDVIDETVRCVQGAVRAWATN